VKRAVFDLDHTLIHWGRPFWHIAADFADIPVTSLPYPDHYGLDVWDTVPTVKQMMIRMFNSEWFMCQAVKPKIFAPNVISTLWSAGYELHIVTARVKKLKIPTMNLVFRMFGYGVDVHVVEPSESKMPIIEDLNPTIYVDDNEKDLRVVAALTDARVYIVDAPWNRDASIPHAFRVEWLDQIIQMEL